MDYAPLFDHWPGLEKALALDLSAANADLAAIDPTKTDQLHAYIFDQLQARESAFAWGGYGEDRSWYRRSRHFGQGDQTRSIHLGIDVWAKANTAVYAPCACQLVGYADNRGFGNYGPTVVMKLLQPDPLYALFGHLSRISLAGLKVGMKLSQGQIIGELGAAEENGQWPPHLHLQLIKDLGTWQSDFPGVCLPADKGEYLANCPDPSSLLA